MPGIDAAVDLSRPRRIHLVGVGGSGIGAMAQALVAMGHHVTGSDVTPSALLERLAAEGVHTWVGHQAAHVADAELVAASTAIPPDNPELVEARRRGLPVLRRAQLLAAICATRRTVAVAGTHGKTTTSTMLALILAEAGWAPSYLIGGDIVGLGTGAAWEAAGEWLVVEADESDGTFLDLPAEAVVVTSVEADHLDHFGDEERLRAAFVAFVSGAPGPRVVCVDDPGSAAVAAAAMGAVVTYGTSPGATVVLEDLDAVADLEASGPAGLAVPGSRFRVLRAGSDLGWVELAVPGAHFARNAAAALTLALELGIDFGTARRALGRYRGVGRRFEGRGSVAGVTLLDDYGHLPGEVAVTLATARSMHRLAQPKGGDGSRLVVAFQPHRYSRTEALWEQFAGAFVDADVVVITDVYAAGEAPRAGVSGELIAGAVRRAHPDAQVHYVPRREALAGTLLGLLRPGDVCIGMGAGDITALPDELRQVAGTVGSAPGERTGTVSGNDG